MRAADIIAKARAAGRTALDEAAGKQLLASVGIAVPRAAVVGPNVDPAPAIGGLRFPVACKVMSPDILHKSDAGGVQLGLDSVEAVVDARSRIAASDAVRRARVDGYLVEEMAPPGLELAIGGVRDPSFGPLIMVGIGGVLVEVLRDVAFRICPIDELDAREMLDDLAGSALLDGYRGRPAVSRDAIVDVLLRVGGRDGLLLALADDLDELDLNPLVVSPAGPVAVDARFVLAPRP